MKLENQNTQPKPATQALSAPASSAFRHRLNLLEYLMQGKRLIRKTDDSADQEEPEYWALQWDGEAIDSVGFASRMFPGPFLFLEFLQNPMPWTVDPADIACEPEVPAIKHE